MPHLLKTHSKLKPYFLIFMLAVAAGLYLHFRNLQGVIYIDEDEARPFALLTSGPLMYLMVRPIYTIFQTQESVFYLAAALGFVSIFLFYFTARLFSDEKIAALAAFFYAIWPLRINYSRTLFPSVFTEFYFLLTFFILFKGILRKSRVMVFAAGFLAAANLFVHMYGYAADFGLLAAFLLFLWFSKEPAYGPREKAHFLGILIIGGLIGILFFQNLLLAVGQGYNYIMGSIVFGRETVVVAHFPSNPFVEIFKKITMTRLMSITTFITLMACLYSLMRVIFSKDFLKVVFIFPFLLGGGIFLILGGLNFHTLFERHFVWLSSFFAWSLSYFFICTLDSTRGKRKGLVLAVSVLLGAFLFAHSYQITQETYKINVLRDWLKKNQVENRHLITSWWQIRDVKALKPDEKTLSHVPGFFERLDPSKPYPLYADLSGMYAMHYAIAWPRIYQAYKTGLCKYIVTSGMNLRAQIGQDEALLKHVKPVASWPHPYEAFTTRPYYDAKAKDLKIEIYRLSDIFSDSNYFILQKERKIK